MEWGEFVIGADGRLDADARQLLDHIAGLDRPPMESREPAAARAQFGRDAARGHAPAPPGIAVEERPIAGPGGPLRLRLYRPPLAGLLPVMVYFHGGGFVVGDLDSHDPICRGIAAGAGSLVVSVDYRLAPEHPYPAAVEDALAALDWVAGNMVELGGDARALAVGGDSAGGTLAAVAALAARDRGGPRLALQVLAYPAVDQGGDYASRRRHGDGALLTAAAIGWFGQHYFGAAGPPPEPWASPLRAADHRHLAPALVITAGFDPLADEGAAYAARLAASGVPVRHLRYAGTLHGCLGLTRFLAAGRIALAEIGTTWGAVAAQCSEAVGAT